MHWADKLAKEIIASGKYKPYWVDDMYTPSGYAHVGSIRGPLIHDLIYKAIKKEKKKIITTYVFNNFDTVDGLPEELRQKFNKYMGFPLKLVPSPENGYKDFADFYIKNFEKVLRSLGIEAQFIYSWDLYQEGKFNEVIKIALDSSEKILKIYEEVSGSRKREKNWLPLQVICEKCGKLGTTKVYEWDGKDVSYKCEPNLVTWAQGCGYEGKMNPFNGRAKLPWKVDWAANWKVLGITIEGSGKEHGTAGGSRDIVRRLCEEVFKYPEPFNLVYEYFLIGGKKMSSSKGLGLKAYELMEIIPPELVRFLFVRTNYREQIEFNPFRTMSIPNLFDEYDRCWESYVNNSDENFSRYFELSQVDKILEKTEVFLPRFRDVANYMQLPNVDLEKKFEEIKGDQLSVKEKEILKEREKYAKIWLENYAPDDFQNEMLETIPFEIKKLDKEQKEFLSEIPALLEKDLKPEDLQVALYNLTKELKIDVKKAFAAIYLSFIGKEFGPKAAWFLLQYSKEKVITRLKEASR